MANEIVSYPVTLVFKTSNRVILILLFTVRKSLPKNLVISNNLSCSLSGEEFREACLSGSSASGSLSRLQPELHLGPLSSVSQFLGGRIYF